VGGRHHRWLGEGSSASNPAGLFSSTPRLICLGCPKSVQKERFLMPRFR
jgi:hypothetical protein